MLECLITIFLPFLITQFNIISSSLGWAWLKKRKKNSLKNKNFFGNSLRLLLSWGKIYLANQEKSEKLKLILHLLKVSIKRLDSTRLNSTGAMSPVALTNLHVAVALCSSSSHNWFGFLSQNEVVWNGPVSLSYI